jgi:hypothetical protein
MLFYMIFDYKNHFYLLKFRSKKNPRSEVVLIQDIKSISAFFVVFFQDRHVRFTQSNLDSIAE